MYERRQTWDSQAGTGPAVLIAPHGGDAISGKAGERFDLEGRSNSFYASFAPISQIVKTGLSDTAAVAGD